jgi:glycosyl transferase family 25
VRIYYINLDRHPERRAHMEDALRGLDSERVAAIDARDWPQPYSGISRFERACLQSHRLAWTRFLQSPEPFGCFMEDDVHLSPDFPGFVGDSGWIPPDAHAVKLDTFFNAVMLDHRVIDLGARRLALLHTRHESCAGYVLSRQGAAAFLAATENPTLPVDYVVFPENPLRKKLRLYQLAPAVVIQDSLYLKHYGKGENFESSIQRLEPKTPVHRRKKLLRVLTREGGRLFRQPAKFATYVYRTSFLRLKPEIIPFN